jgi:uncharacterized protein (DUF2141 family)
MFKRFFATICMALAFIPVMAAAEVTTLDVKVTGADPATGTIEISVFRGAEEFLKDSLYQRQCKPSEDGSCSVNFLMSMPGEYAVVVVHDANDNQKFDNGFLGFGAESFAYSNEASNPLFGRASFDDAKISVSGDTRIEISLD